MRRYKRMRAGVATSPHFPGVDHHTLQHGTFPRADQVPDEALRLRSVPSRVSRRNLAASVGPQRESHQSELRWGPFRGSFAQRLRFRRTSLESGSGIGFRLCLTLLPSIALPLACRRSSLRMSAASAVAVTSSFRPFPARRPLITKIDIAPASGVAPSGICLWISRIMGISLDLKTKDVPADRGHYGNGCKRHQQEEALRRPNGFPNQRLRLDCQAPITARSWAVSTYCWNFVSFESW